MPIHDQSYRHWEGTLRSHTFRWWIVAKEGLRVILRRKLFLLFVLGPPAIQFFAFGAIVYGVNTYGKMFKLDMINPTFFLQFAMRQSFFIALICVFAGSGLIANDLKNNALQLYLSKPLTRLDYLAGKVVIVLILLGFVTLLPCIILFIENAVLVQDSTFIQENYWILGSITIYSLILIVPTSLLILALSSMTRNNRYAAISFVAILMGTPIFSEMLKVVLKLKWAVFISYWSNIHILGRKLLKLPTEVEHWYISIIIILIISGVCIWIMQRRVKGVEIVK